MTEMLSILPMPTAPLLSRGTFGNAKCDIPSLFAFSEAVFTRSGRSAITLALRLAGIGSGDEVLIPNYYCPTMAAPVEHVGATARFYPIRRDAAPDIDWLQKNTSDKCKAVIAAHFFGIPMDFSSLRVLCDECHLVLIEDCAHAFFGSCSDIRVGSQGHYAIASLAKFFPVIDGGALVSSSKIARDAALSGPSLLTELKAVWNLLEIAARYNRLRGMNAPIKVVAACFSRMKGDARSNPTVLPPVESEKVRSDALDDPLLVPNRFGAAQRWIVQHCDRQRIVDRRRSNYRYLADSLSYQPGLELLFPKLPESAAPYVFPVFLDDADRIYAELREKRLPVLRWDRYWPGAIESETDIGRQWGHHVIQILCHQDLSDDDMRIISSSLLSSLNRS